MVIDDRLATVLRQRAGGQAIARIQFRQLLDLLGTAPGEARSEQLDAAFARLAELSGKIAIDDRARMLRDPGLRLRSPRLIAALAGQEPQIGAAAIVAAQLDEEQWLDLAPALPIQVRSLMRLRRDLGPAVVAQLERLGIRDRGLPAAEGQVEVLPPAPQRAAESPERGRDGIGAIVRRIEEYRKTRTLVDAPPAPGESPRLPLGDLPARPAREIGKIDFTTDAEGRIDWAGEEAAPMVVGMRLAAAGGGGAFSPAVARAVRRRQPIRSVPVEIEGAPAIAGPWRMDAAPRFDRANGRFTSYAGRLRRPALSPEAAAAAAVAGEADRVRQLLHELRTPVNAIQGFAEVIQQQLFGPSPHEYRALAAGIASDAAHILAAFDELERLARLEAGALDIERGDCDLAALVEDIVSQLSHFTAPRSSGFALESAPARAAIAREEAERTVWRLLAALAAAAAPGEVLALRCGAEAGEAVLEVRLPASLAAAEGDALFHTGAPGQAVQSLTAGPFGPGFTLRLARAEARGAGGGLERRGEALHLALPGLTAKAAGHSQVRKRPDQAPG